VDEAPRVTIEEASDQLPAWLRRFDDRRGITWRVVNQVRRTDPRRSLRMARALVHPPRHVRPVFVLGAPRSGTTSLFEILSANSQLGSLGHEGHDLWRAFHHPRYSGWRSDVVDAHDVRPGERRYVNAYLGTRISRDRIVEKTPENCLRIPYLLELFPDASVVAVHREPLDTINSLINGWRHPRGRYRSYFVPQDLTIPGYPHARQWCFALIDGWRDLSSAGIAEIAFAQWKACTVGLDSGRGLLAPDRWTDVHLGDLVADPHRVVATIAERIGVDVDEAMTAKAERVARAPLNALSAPGTAKWTRDNPDEIRPLLERVAQLAHLAGYEVDALSGRTTRTPG
jgi:Sulfotransferase family